jgi:hypothetical protein
MLWAYLDENNTVVKTSDIEKWSACRSSGRFIVKLEVVRNRRISTVFLGIDHQFADGPELWFETMVFAIGDHLDLDMDRYTTYAQAVEGHARMVERWREKDPEDV